MHNIIMLPRGKAYFRYCKAKLYLKCSDILRNCICSVSVPWRWNWKVCYVDGKI